MVRLTRKLAEEIDGIDLTGRQVGDFLSLSGRDAQLIIAEGWAEPVVDDGAGPSQELASAAERSNRPK
jgi:hypothetical protein